MTGGGGKDFLSLEGHRKKEENSRHSGKGKDLKTRREGSITGDTLLLTEANCRKL